MQVSHGTHHHQDACLHRICANPDLTQPQQHHSLPTPLGCQEAPRAFLPALTWSLVLFLHLLRQGYLCCLTPHVSGLESGQVCSQPPWIWPQPSCLVTVVLSQPPGLLCPPWAHVSLAHCFSLHPDPSPSLETWTSTWTILTTLWSLRASTASLLVVHTAYTQVCDNISTMDLSEEVSFIFKIMIPIGRVMAPHSSTLAWRIPWTEEPGGLQPMGSLRVGHDCTTSLSLFTLMHWRRKWQPTPVFLPGESQGRGSLLGCRLWGHTESDTTEVT